MDSGTPKKENDGEKAPSKISPLKNKFQSAVNKVVVDNQRRRYEIDLCLE
jgi:hypothetical protein